VKVVQPTLDVLMGQAEQLQKAGRPADAARLYETWIAANDSPAKCVALFNWGVLLAAMGELDRADAAYREAFAQNPKLHQARINAGLVAERKHNEAEALKLWLDVAAAATGAEAPPDALPFATIALNHVGRLQESRRQYAAAEAALANSLRFNPAQPDAIQHWVHLRQKQCTWPVFAPMAEVSVNALLASTSPLAMLAAHDDPALQWLASSSFVRRKYPLVEGRLARPRARGKGAIRIGYLSGDLCTHAVGLLMAELLESHDRTAFTVIAFDFSPEDGTAHRARLRRACDEMINIRALDDRTAAQVISDTQIDVLIDLHGLSSGARPGILALRPAPLIGTYLGFIGTTSLPWIDFVITDHFTLPDVLTPYVSERPLYIDGSMIPLHSEPVTTCRFTRHDVGLPDNAMVLACFNNVYKFNPELFDCWLRVLQRSEQSVLWLLDDNVWATTALREHAARAGIGPDRIVFAPRCTHAEYREKLTLADLYLDTFPYNAGSTARDVLDAALPMVTLAGRTMVSRMAGGMLHAARLGDLVTTSYDDYEDLIVELAADPARLASIRARMHDSADEWTAAPAALIRSLERQLVELCRWH
jgi:predicted O-linked N-acetylglucosamine transferase (SPINDLY family)